MIKIYVLIIMLITVFAIIGVGEQLKYVEFLEDTIICLEAGGKMVNNECDLWHNLRGIN